MEESSFSSIVAELREWFDARSPERRTDLSLRLDLPFKLVELIPATLRDGGEGLGKRERQLVLGLADCMVTLAASAAAPSGPAAGPPRSYNTYAWLCGWLVQLTGAAQLLALTLQLANTWNGAELARLLRALVVVTSSGAAFQQAVRLLREQPMELLGAAPHPDPEPHLMWCLEDLLHGQAMAVNAAIMACSKMSAAAESSAAGSTAGSSGCPQLRPDAVLPWLRQAVTGAEWLLSRRGIVKPASQMFELLSNAVKSSAVGNFAQALCSDSSLLRRLARLTTDVHAALLATLDCTSNAWSSQHASLCRWSSSWNLLPGGVGQQGTLLPLLATAGSLLRGEAALLGRLPTQPPAGADRPQAALLAECWQYAVNCISRHAAFMLQVHGPLEVPPASRLRQLLLTLAAAAPHVLRYVKGVTAGGAAAGAVVRSSLQPFDLAAILRQYASVCGLVCDLRSAASAQEQDEELSAAIELAGALQGLLALLPHLALVVNPASCAAEGPSRAEDCRGSPGSSNCPNSSSSSPDSSSSAITAGSCQDDLKFDVGIVSAAAVAAYTCFMKTRCNGIPFLPGTRSLHGVLTGWCRLAHALLAASPRVLRLLRFDCGAGSRGLDASLLAATIRAHYLRVGEALGSAQHVTPTEEHDRRLACGLLQALAAVAALQVEMPVWGAVGADPPQAGAQPARLPGAARARAMHSLVQMTCEHSETLGDGEGAAPEAPASGQEAEVAQLARVRESLAGRLSCPSSPGLLMPLLERLLPPEAAAEEGAGTSAASTADVPIEAAMFRAHSLALRPCSYLCCPGPPISDGSGSCSGRGGSSTKAARGKFCAGCMTVRYGSAACQRADWAVHRCACRRLTADAAVGGEEAAS